MQMRTKAFLPGLLAGLLLIVFVAAFRSPVSAQQEAPETKVSGEWEYRIADKTIHLTGYTGFSQEVEVPATLEQFPVSVIGDGLFRDHTEIKRVVLPDSVVTIGLSAFSGCTSLEDLRLPAELVRIQNEAFRYCSALQQLELPVKLTTIGAAAFEGCSTVKSLRIPNSVTTIGANAFQYCNALSSVTFSKNLRTLGENAFAFTPWLAAQTDEFVLVGNKILLKYNGTDAVVTVPLQVTAIVDAFADNVTVEEVILPRTLTIIGDNAFKGCQNLKNIRIPQSVTTIGNNAFRGCRSLQKILIPETVTSIGSGAFQECSSLATIALPSGVKAIQARQFAFCPALTRFTIPATVETIHNTAFENSNAVSLEVVYGTIGEEFAKTRMIPYTFLIEQSPDFAFRRSEAGVEIIRYLGQIYDIQVPEYISGAAVWKIGPGAFQKNTFARNVTLPASVREISEWAFAYSDTLSSLQIAEGTTKIGSNAFTGSQNLRDLVIPASVTEIGSDAFTNCPNLMLQTITGSAAWKEAVQAEIPVTDPFSSFGDFELETQDGIYTLSGYTGTAAEVNLISNVLGLAVTKVGTAAFQSSTVQTIWIPEGYTSIANHAFASIGHPLTITFPDSLIEIAANTFEGTDVTIQAHTGTAAEAYARKHGFKFLVSHE